MPLGSDNRAADFNGQERRHDSAMQPAACQTAVAHRRIHRCMRHVTGEWLNNVVSYTIPKFDSFQFSAQYSFDS